MTRPLHHLPGRPQKEIVHELMQACAFEEAGNLSGASSKAAHYLFQDVAARIGVDAARQIFLQFAAQPTPERLKRWKHQSLVSRYDMMRAPNVRQLAREIAKENENLPRRQQHGPWGTEWSNIEKLIRRLLKARRVRLDKSKTEKSRTKRLKR